MPKTQPDRPMHILLVDDSSADAHALKEIFIELKKSYQIRVVKDGVEAMEFLRASCGSGGEPRPDLVLLDLRMPNKDGFEVLAEIKTDPALKRLPVIVLTSSESPKDIHLSYDLHANCYIRKPGNMEELAAAVKLICEFWLELVQLPPE